MVNEAVSTGILDQVLQEFLVTLKGDYHQIENLAKGLFFYLAGIQIVISAIYLIFKNDPLEAAVKTIQIFFTMSVFYTLVLFGDRWMPQIINGFIQIGSSASGIVSLTPSSIMDQGISIGFAIWDNFSNWGWVTHPFGSILATTILIAIIILYALLAAEIAIILIKSYVLVTLSGLMFAFGATEALRSISMNYFKAVIGIGLQLMAFYLIMGVGIRIGQDWAVLIGKAAEHHELKPFLVVMAAVIVFYLIVKNVPPFIAGLSGIGGFRSFGDEAVASAITAGATGANAIGNAVRGSAFGAQAFGQVLKGAGNLGGSFGQPFEAGGSKTMNIIKGFGHATANTASSFGGAVKDSVMKNNQDMSFGQKFNANMSAKVAQQSATIKTPTPDFKPNSIK